MNEVVPHFDSFAGRLFWHSNYAVVVSAANPKSRPVLATYMRDCFAAIEDVKRLEESSDA